MRLFVIAVRDKRLTDLDSLLSVAEGEAERLDAKNTGQTGLAPDVNKRHLLDE